MLRFLARPHAVHHEWLDRSLAIHPERQLANVWCHLVPEYLTQLAFSFGAWLVVPGAMVAVCIFLQTVTFAGLLAYRGLDINHRPVQFLDAYRPSWIPFPEYHALHHVYPDAHFSSYGKLVDWVVGGGTMLRGRRFALHGGDTLFAVALRRELEKEDIASLTTIEGTDAELADCDVLALCAAGAREQELVERFIDATRARQLPPEVWSVHRASASPLARHYYRDTRVIYRVLLTDGKAETSEARAVAAARSAVFWIRRGACFISTAPPLVAVRDFARFRRSQPAPPIGVTWRRSRRQRAVAADTPSLDSAVNLDLTKS